MESFTLSNGLRVVYVPMDRRSVLVTLKGNVGRRAEHETEVGAAHFLEHLLFDGTERMSTSQELARFTQAHGIRRNGVTSAEHVEYWASGARSQVEYIFSYLGDITQHSLLRQEDIVKERKVIAQEAALRKTDPASALSRMVLRDVIANNHPLGRTIFQDEEFLASMTSDVLRGYMQRVYGAENFVLGIGGGISESDARRFAEQSFNSFPTLGAATPPSPARLREGSYTRWYERDIEQAQVEMVLPGIGRVHPDALTYVTRAMVFGRIFAQGSASHLYQRVREQEHLVYHIGGDSDMFSDIGLWSISFAATSENIPKVFSAICDEATHFLQRGVSREELESAKVPLLTGLEMSLDSYDSILDAHMNALLTNVEFWSVDMLMEHIRNVTPEDIMFFARELFAMPCKTYILGRKEAHVPGPDRLVNA
ncbi:MAG: pitrilysin family protein [Patescibacteria group bacterium]